MPIILNPFEDEPSSAITSTSPVFTVSDSFQRAMQDATWIFDTVDEVTPKPKLPKASFMPIGKPQVGQVVILNSLHYTPSPNNPVWGSKEGNITGVIAGVSPVCIVVKWSNGHINTYDKEALLLFNETVKLPKKAKRL